MELKYSKVKFNQDEHTYTREDGKQLSGITSLLDRQLFKDKYLGVDDAILDTAKNRGTLIHETIEVVDSLSVESDIPEVLAYLRLKQENNLTTVENEYLVSDNDHVASSIDIVFNDCSIADIKTTSKLDKDYVRWQLSTYAYLFELQNPTLQVNKLYAIWLPKSQYGRPALIELNRIPTSEVVKLIECDKKGEQYTPPVGLMEIEQSTALTFAPEVIREVCELNEARKQLETKWKELQQGLLEQMKEHNVKSFKCDELSMTYKGATERSTLNTKKLKEDYPDIYNKYLETSIIKESILIKTI